jgi:hypothetical protein
MDLDVLYQDLLKKYVVDKGSGNYPLDAKKVSDFLNKNEQLLKDNMHMNNVSLSQTNNFTAYPDYDDNNFNRKIFQKKEFIRHFNDVDDVIHKDKTYDEIAKSKCSDTTFKLTANQKFIKNFLSPLTPYNGLLLFHSVGVGKTCTAISIAEQYHQLYQKPILVILSPTLIDNFKKQIFDITKYDVVTNKSNLCTGTKYPDMILDKALIKQDVLEKNIQKIINQRYKFISYKKLISIFQKTKEKVQLQEKDVTKHDKLFYDKIKDFFSNRLIIIDEAHNLRNSSEKGTKQTAQVFWNLLKHTENVKMVLLTATPMFNNANEIVWFLNLLLTNDKRPNLKMNDIFDKNENLTAQGRRKLIEVARGYVSYMRGENPFSFPMRLYPDINNDKNIITTYPLYDINKKKVKLDDKIKFLKIIGSNMKHYHRSVYDAYKKKVAIDDDITELDVIMENSDEQTNSNSEQQLDKVGNDLQTMAQISNIVYPVSNINDPYEAKKSYGAQGFNNVFVNTAKKGLKYKYKNEITSKFGEILSYKNIANYAPKMKQILDYVVNSNGIVFIYTNYYPSGILPLAIALEHIGFVKYNSNNLSSDITVEDKFKNGKRPSYIILSRDGNLSPNNDKEIEVAKSRENANGNIVKVIISRISEGVDFKRIREVHMLEPWYNLNKCEQIIGRAVRTCSHIDLPKEERNVTVYFHATKYDEVQESVDLWTYRVAENKQKRITEVEKAIKETSIDCNLNRDSLIYNIKDLNMNIPLHTSQGTKIRKYAVGDRDFSYVCNYSKCELKCDPEIKQDSIKSIDDSTYDNRFIMDDVQLYERYISEIYLYEKKAFTYKTIFNKLTSTYKLIDEEVLQYALQDMIDDKYQLFDNENTRGYLIYRSNKYIFQPFNSSDKRMTLEQRETPNEVKNRVRLDLSVLKSKIDHEQAKHVKNNSKVSDDEVQDVEFSSVFGYIEEMYNNFFETYGVYSVNKKKYEKFVIDSIIDKLSKLNYIKLFKEIARIYNNNGESDIIYKNCLRSLIEADVIIFEDTKAEKIKYFYNYYDGEIYCIRSDGDFKRCSPLDINKISKQIISIKAKMTNDLEETVKGHVDVSGVVGNGDFKVRDNPKSTGYVCWKTSSLSLNDLKERITSFDKDIKFDNLIKKDICLLYEIILRSQGKKVFKRSITKKLK